MNFETYLRTELERGIIDFAIRAQKNSDGRISFYIHPARESGNTADYVVRENDLIEGPWQVPQQGGFMQHIILNYRDVAWPNNTITYEELIELAYPGMSAYVFSVVWQDKETNRAGTLTPGKTLTLTPFMRITAIDTSNA